MKVKIKICRPNGDTENKTSHTPPYKLDPLQIILKTNKQTHNKNIFFSWLTNNLWYFHILNNGNLKKQQHPQC